MDFPTDIASSGGTSHPNSRERRSALARISEPDLRDHISPRPVSSLDSGRLQEVEIQYDGAENSQYLSPVIAVNSGLPTRIPATFRLSDNDKAGPSQVQAFLPPSALAKAASKRRVTKQAPNKRVARSPPQGVKIKKLWS